MEQSIGCTLPSYHALYSNWYRSAKLKREQFIHVIIPQGCKWAEQYEQAKREEHIMLALHLNIEMLLIIAGDLHPL